MDTMLLINIMLFVVLLLTLFYIFKIKGDTWSLAKKVLLGLSSGVMFGLGLHFAYPHPEQNTIITQSIQWINIIGNGYIRLLQMIVMPLVFASILSAVAKLNNASSLGKISVITLGTLLFTTMIAALVGVFVTILFKLNASGLTGSTQEHDALNNINQHLLKQVEHLDVPNMLVSFIPRNPFNALADTNTTAIISIVIFAVFLGAAAIKLLKEDQKKGQKILDAIDLLQAWVMKLVRLVMQLTPYGVMALMTKMIATSNFSELMKLASFIIASYLGLSIMFIIHGILLSLTGIHPIKFFTKIWPVLTFAFVSRSSAATIPLNVEAQTRRIGVPESIASFSASFGATIGQNGCAGLYPAMLAVMVAPTLGINPLDPSWIATLVFIVTISSLGVAGVGGGATFAALIVLPAMGLPIELVALLVSIEPLIDMGRTALNVSGSMTAGTVTSQLLRQTNKKIFNTPVN